jgi:protein subunit release factor A
MKLKIAGLLFLTLSSNTLIAEDIKTLLDKVQQYNSEGNYSKALEELTWVKKEIETKYMAKLGELLPTTLAGYTGEKAETSSALGMNHVSKKYKNESNTAVIEITSGSGGAAAGMGGLAALGQMAAMFGQQQGQATIRIKGKTANLQAEAGEMTIYLDGGTMISIKQENGKVDFKTLAEAIDFDSIEKFMKGI